MASGHLGQICPRDGVQRLQDRIHSQAPDNVEGVVDGDPQEPLWKRGSRKRAPVHAGQTSHQGNPGVTRHTRVLLPDFPSSQGIGWLEADSKPQGFQQIRSAPSFWMETLRTVMDCLGEAAQLRRNTSEQ